MKHSFGGSLLIQKRKSKRPLDFKKSTHLVLRLKDHLPKLFNPRDPKLRKLFLVVAGKYDIKFYDLIFNHSHVHAVIKIPDRESYVKFVRELTSNVVAYFTNSCRIKFKNIFVHRPWTRVVNWGKSFHILKKYMLKNELESGFQQIHLSPKSFTGLRCENFIQPLPLEVVN